MKLTEIYSKTSVKMKKAALDKLNTNNSVNPDKVDKEWTGDQNLMEWLAQMGR